MKWTQVDIVGPEIIEETAIASLAGVGCSGVQVIRQEDLPEFDTDWLPTPPAVLRLSSLTDTEVIVRGFLPDGVNPEPELRAALDRSGPPECMAGCTSVIVSHIDDPGWSRSWRKYFKPSRVGKRLVIAPSWARYRGRKDDLVVLLDPGMAFGTGQHASTRLCLLALEKHLRPGDSVLDVGCGSGILSIAAVRLGAVRALALDTDSVAVATATENVAANSLTASIRVERGSLPTTAAPVDVVVANILAPVIIALASEAKEALKPGGFFISSGIVKTQEEDVRLALDSAGFKLVEQGYSDEWTSLVAQRPGSV